VSAKLLAFSGKGGCGKTTLAALTLRELIRAGVRPILAVDADPNATLGLTLGVEVPGTIADLRDRMGQAAQSVGEIPKERLLDQWLAELLAERTGFDLLTMGRPEGPKCYCYVNGLLRRYLRELRDNYAAVVVDCEAGMEYLSRLTVGDVDMLVLVAESNPIGLVSAQRIIELAKSLPMAVHKRVLVLNKVGLLGPADEVINEDRFPAVDAVLRVAYDETILRRSMLGQTISQDEPPAPQAVKSLVRMCDQVGLRAVGTTGQKEPEA